MKNKLLLCGIFLSCLNFSTYSQRNCGTMHHYEQLLQKHPEIHNTRQQIENFTDKYVSSNNHEKAIVNIPVVVHVVYNTTSQNITDAQIQSQINVLNKDFRKLNSDVALTPSTFSSVVADCEINFCLASISPTGTTTTGIIRKQTTSTSFIDDDKVKSSTTGGSDAWNTSKYLNIWVCNLGNDLLGYAQFPGGPTSTDGVVINYTAFGTTGTAIAPFNKGRTATHEIGHWLNLYHIGGDASGGCGNDLVSDTPTQKGGSSANGTGNDYGQNYGCPTHPLVRSGECSGTTAEMFMNYMDYTDDACMYMFTTGQKNRMKALLTTGGARAGLLTSNGCGGSTTPTTSYCTSSSSNTQYEWISNVNLNTINNTTSGLNGYNDYTNISTTLLSGNSYSIKLTPAYSGSIYSEYFNVYIDYNKDFDFNDTGELVYSSPAVSSQTTAMFTVPSSATIGSTRMRVVLKDAVITGPCETFTYGEVEDYTINIQNATTTCTDNYESNETRSAAKLITTNTIISAKIGTATDIDWFKFSNSTTQKNIKISLTNLPANYDVRLYNSSGTLLASSLNTGLNNELIVYNTTTVATYYIRVSGVSGANSSSSCYTLQASISASTSRMEFDETFENTFNVYPNPSTNGNIVLNLQNEIVGNINFVVYDNFGRNIFQTQFLKEEFELKESLNIPNLEKGIYFIQCVGNDLNENVKLLVE